MLITLKQWLENVGDPGEPPNTRLSRRTTKRESYFECLPNDQQDYIRKSIVKILGDALGVDEDEVMSNATLVNDLGTESIDFLDIVFRLERHFGIKIPRLELFPNQETLKSIPEMTSIAQRVNFIDANFPNSSPSFRAKCAAIDSDSLVDDMVNVPITVGMIEEYIALKVEKRGQK